MSEPRPEETSKLEDEWLIRPCEYYEREYSDCTSLKERFHQYFIFGATNDCLQWKRDSDNCYRWQEKKDLKSGNELIESESKRRLERLKPHYGNTVWEKRKTPPDNWNAPLPEFVSKNYETSYLNIKAREMRGETAALDEGRLCVIL